MTSRIANTLKQADTTAGRTKLAARRSLPASSPPIGGPSVKPMPIAAPTIPRVRGALLRALTSEAYAKAAAMLPAMKPPRMRETNSHPGRRPSRG